ncbi:DeoR family transcriptional regulator [Paracoccus versutus]|uniref:DeoR family transcriptional regulator n=1 Tax=Paracoccus versutus TaxID=34007 RepID=A0AAQ0KLD8_PARVE|nr:DeoR/GlpR family DNA-binding transcription regulator [Paracoccus versutus]KGJ11137.1 hypothetical protein IT40_08120 [Paracoccus versutus]REG46223.1 DeoR family transcriptional regulator [Paracoccus versutus]
MSDSILFTGADKKLRRQELLLEQVLRTGYVSVEEISRRFNVTPQTARRDLADLLATGRVRRCHGGMTPAVPFDAMTRRVRRSQNTAAKRRIADIVADLVHDESSVYLDSGSTMEIIAEALASKRRGLTVTTTSARIAVELSEREDFIVHVPTGTVRGGDNSIVGESVAPWLQEQRFDILVMTAGGVSEDGGISIDTPIEVPILTAAVAASSRVILAVDATKLEFMAPERLMDISKINDFVTNTRLSRGLMNRVSAAGINLHSF